MNLVVNGEPTTLPDATTVRELVASLVASERGVAVAVDREVVPRSHWADHVLQDGVEVEVLTAAAGG